MWDYLIIFLFTLLFIFAVKFVNWVWLEPKKTERFLRKQGLKGNPYRLLHGDTKEISAMYAEAHSRPIGLYDDIIPRTMPFIAHTIHKYGKNSFAWIGPKPRIIITDSELMKVVLNKYRNFPKKVSNKFINLAIGGLAHHEGDEWNKSRMKLNPAFHLDILKQKVPGMQACATDILNLWKQKMSDDGYGVVDVLHYLEDFSGSVVTQTLFSTAFDEEMKRNFQHIMDLTVMASTASKPFSIPGFWYMPTETKKNAIRMEKELRDSYTRMINERLNRRLELGDNYGQDLLDVFLDELYQGNVTSSHDRKMIIDEAIGNCKLFYFAGYDTTSSLLTWTLITLAIHQNWQDRAREEVIQLLGNNSEITNDMLNQMKTVTMILYEVLRLYPPVMEISRVVEEDTVLGEYHIPKGVLMQLPVAILHREKEIWGEDALDFRPDRFSEGVLKAANGHAAFMPFSWGPRICIGQNFALMESKIFVAQLLGTFSLELSPTYIHAPYSAYMIQPQYGAPLLLHEL